MTAAGDAAHVVGHEETQTSCRIGTLVRRSAHHTGACRAFTAEAVTQALHPARMRKGSRLRDPCSNYDVPVISIMGETVEAMSAREARP